MRINNIENNYELKINYFFLSFVFYVTKDCNVMEFCLVTGDTASVRNLSLKHLLPNTDGYMTYEGSTTHPGCWETAVWLILNKPIYITAQEVKYRLLEILQGFYVV